MEAEQRAAGDHIHRDPGQAEIRTEMGTSDEANYACLEVALMMISIPVFCFVPQNVWLENLANSKKRRGQEVELR